MKIFNGRSWNLGVKYVQELNVWLLQVWNQMNQQSNLHCKINKFILEYRNITEVNECASINCHSKYPWLALMFQHNMKYEDIYKKVSSITEVMVKLSFRYVRCTKTYKITTRTESYTTCLIYLAVVQVNICNSNVEIFKFMQTSLKAHGHSCCKFSNIIFPFSMFGMLNYGIF